jgi:WD40 repeat protein
MLTGRPPFLAETALDTMMQVLADEPVSPRRLQPRVPSDVENICLKCLHKDQARRYASALDLAEDLCRFREGRPVQARPVSTRERLWRWCRRNPALATASALAALTTLCLTAVLIGLAFYQAEVTRDLAAKHQATQEALQEAQKNFKDSKRQGALLALDRGLGYCEDGDCSRGLLFLAGSLESATQAGDVALERFLRASLGGWRRQMVPLRALLPHEGELAVFSPDGRTLLTTDTPNSVRLWDTATGQPLGAPLRHDAKITAAAFSPDNQTILLGSADGIARFWDVATGKPRNKVLEHQRNLLVVAYHPDGKTVLTASLDNAVRLWDARSGEPRDEPLRHEGTIQSVAFSPDGKTILTRNEDGKRGEAILWETATGKVLAKPLLYNSTCTLAEFNPDNQTVLTADWEPVEEMGRVQLWSIATGKPRGEPLQIANRISKVAFRGDGKAVLLSVDSHAQLYSVETGKPIGPVLDQKNAVTAVAMHPDGRTAVTASLNGTAQLWDAKTGRRIGEPLEHQRQVDTAVFSPDGKTLLTRGKDNMVRLWDVSLGQPLYVKLPEAVERKSGETVFSPDRRRMVTVFTDSVEAHLYDPSTGKLIGAPLKHDDKINVAVFSPDGRMLLTRSADRKARLWAVDTGKPIGAPLDPAEGVMVAAFDPGARTVVTVDSKGTVYRWEVATGKARKVDLEFDQVVRSLAFSPDGKTICAGGSKDFARLWDAATGKPRSKPLKHEGALESVAFAPDGKTVLTSGKKAVCLWEVATGKKIADPIQFPQSKITAVAYSPDGKTVATAWGGKDMKLGGARLWDACTGKPKGEPLPHRDRVNALAFSPDGTKLLTGCADNTGRLWDVAAARPIGPTLTGWSQPPGRAVVEEGPEPPEDPGVTAVAFGPDGSTLLLVGEKQQIRLWKVPEPVQGSVDEIRLWAQVVTGMELDVGGGPQFLAPQRWQKQRVLLHAFAHSGATMIEPARIATTVEPIRIATMIEPAHLRVPPIPFAPKISASAFVGG